MLFLDALTPRWSKCWVLESCQSGTNPNEFISLEGPHSIRNVTHRPPAMNRRHFDLLTFIAPDFFRIGLASFYRLKISPCICSSQKIRPTNEVSLCLCFMIWKVAWCLITEQAFYSRLLRHTQGSGGGKRCLIALGNQYNAGFPNTAPNIRLSASGGLIMKCQPVSHPP